LFEVGTFIEVKKGEGMKAMSKAWKSTHCPFLGEILMEYCRAYPVKKPVPKSQSTTKSPCAGGEFRACPLFREILAKLEAAASEKPEIPGRKSGREVT
jgi:hypothetical protein